MRLSYVIVFNLVVVALAVGAGLYFYSNQSRIAYVRSYELINKYQGTIEARASFEQKKAAMMAQVDSLQFDFDRSRNSYVESMNRLTAADRSKREEMLTRQHQQVVQYGQAIEQKIKEEDALMMQEVLNQVNSFVEEYAVKNGYDVVLGTTSSGSLLYGNKSLDITETLIQDLNNHFKGK